MAPLHVGDGDATSTPMVGGGDLVPDPDALDVHHSPALRARHVGELRRAGDGIVRRDHDRDDRLLTAVAPRRALGGQILGMKNRATAHFVDDEALARVARVKLAADHRPSPAHGFITLQSTFIAMQVEQIAHLEPFR